MDTDKVNLASQNAMGAGSSLGLASREKLWPERTTEEKLEALRQSVVHMLSLAQNLHEQVSGLNTHQHLPSGQMVGPITGPNHGGHRNRTPMGLRDRE